MADRGWAACSWMSYWCGASNDFGDYVTYDEDGELPVYDDVGSYIFCYKSDVC
ncbi:uncharacterized protein L969DRAFT_94925 [Mixia osmundae IAM 14324]|uniref:Uncharacterized protein n=1 Tax=Mixia osmundae (strain CBS 9802 / IAM 14324 / JCM 22182 / KY 12970) TaxID=764103 RepID=G7E1B1_MIXOS|nr:uncharacterized protein L969DRAFT_94925 [Mixia osmundae IAM 14324]KEI38741.1 hypothetical protein L969DRAFT_94925 [Mixia osmundae IAM 14324]GAA96621.1 hypothetical protein E5Q_03291 [Mixia osmundae IAM 14324]